MHDVNRDRLSFLIVGSTFLILMGMLFLPHDDKNDNMIITAIISISMAVVGYYYGSAKKAAEEPKEPGTTTTVTTVTPKDPIPTEDSEQEAKKP